MAVDSLQIKMSSEHVTVSMNLRDQIWFKMAEMDSPNSRPWRILVTLGSLMLVLLLTLVLRQEASKSLEQLTGIPNQWTVWLQISLAMCEGLILILVLDFQSAKPVRCYIESLVIFIFGHVIFTSVQSYITVTSTTERNFVMSWMLLEPAMSIGIVCLTTKKQQSLAINVIVTGMCVCAAILISPLSNFLTLNRCISLAMLSEISVSARNVCCRYVNQEHSVEIIVRKKSLPAILLSVSIIVPLTSGLFLSTKYLVPVTLYSFAMTGAVISVVMTTKVLNNLGVISLALLHMWVYIIYHMVYLGHFRQDGILVCFCLVGLMILQILYVKEKLEKNGSSSLLNIKLVSLEELHTRLLFLLFSSTVGALILYVLTPSFSRRDLNTLSYVGLDRVFRHLLQSEDQHS